MAVARETLEGNLRGVLSTLTPEEVNQDREKFAGELLHEADHDLARLGLELDTLKVQHVSDDKGYLALDRPQADRRAAQEVAHRRGREPRARGRELGLEPHEPGDREGRGRDRDGARRGPAPHRRGADAQGRADRRVAGARSRRCVAKATAELEVQRARLAQVRFQLIADKVKPAEAPQGADGRAGARRRVEDHRGRQGDRARRSARSARRGRRPATTRARSSSRRSCSAWSAR